MKQIWRILRFSGSLWRYYGLISLFTLLVAGMTQVVPLLTKNAIDYISVGLQHGHTNVRAVGIDVLLIFASDIGQTLFSNFGGYYGDILSVKQQRLLSNRYYQKVMSLPQAYFDNELTGTIINRMSRGIQQISNFVQTFSNNFLQFIFSSVFTLLIVAYYSWPVAILLFSLYPIFIYLTSLSSGTWHGYQKTVNQDLDMASGRFAESVSQLKVVKSFGREEHELGQFDDLLNRVVHTTFPQSRYWHSRDMLRRSVLAIVFLAIYAIIFIQTARGRYTIGTMVLLVQYAQLIRIPLFSISFLVDQTQRAVANTRDYFAVIDETSEIADQPDARPLTVTAGKVVFDEVSFSYSTDAQVLQSLSFAIAPDSKVALVGESGEGKTTITSLLLRFYDVQAGRILIDDQNISSVTQSSLRQNIAIVFQEPVLFSGTIRDNIAYALDEVSEDRVIAAAKSANAHQFISGFKNGYDTEIGERGLKLSGGQKQRIAIARALLKDAPILILDEATSSLDSRSERLVQEALERLMKGRTTIIIAHRLSTIQSVDQIVTITGGSVDEIGTPAELAASDGIYAQLLSLQAAPTAATKRKLKAYELSSS